MTAAFWILRSLSLDQATLYILQYYRGFHPSLQANAKLILYLIVDCEHPHSLSNSSSSDHLTFRIFLSGTSRYETDTQAYEKQLLVAALFMYWSYCDIVLHVSGHVQTHRQEKGIWHLFFSNWVEICSTLRSLYENCCKWQFFLILTTLSYIGSHTNGTVK